MCLGRGALATGGRAGSSPGTDASPRGTRGDPSRGRPGDANPDQVASCRSRARIQRAPRGAWSGRWDSNPRLAAPKAAPLPTEVLPVRLTAVVVPGTRRRSVIGKPSPGPHGLRGPEAVLGGRGVSQGLPCAGSPRVDAGGPSVSPGLEPRMPSPPQRWPSSPFYEGPRRRWRRA